MKNKSITCNIFLLVLIILMLSGCVKSNSYNSSNSSKESDKLETTQSNIQNYSIYNIDNIDYIGLVSGFDKQIENNEIDKSYTKDVNNAITTQEFVEVQNQYIDKWKSEMQKDIASLKAILNETDFNEFLTAQNDWEKQILESAKSDHNIIQNNQYGIDLGSSFRWTWLSNIRDQYRSRTFHIKYILYLLNN